MPGPDYLRLYARSIRGLGSSPIRDILKLTENTNVISLNGGYPAPESFPIEIMKRLSNIVLSSGPQVLQYQKTEGYQPLLDILPSFLARENRRVIATPENIGITAGSQEALDMLGTMLLDPGDKVAVESPTYLGALQAWKPKNPKYIEIETDSEGVTPLSLEKAFIEHPDIKFVYLIPTFQNPTGKAMSLERRIKIANILKLHGKLAIEDDPYSEIRFEGEHLPSLYALAPENVIHLFTFSKTFAPGFRIGGLVAPKDFIVDFNKLKQGMGLFTGGFDQAMVAEYIKGGYLDEQVTKNIELYRPRRDAMVQAISENFPPIFDFTIPQGGLFYWASLKKEYAELSELFNMNELLNEAIKNGVSFVPGAAFFANGTGKEVAMRLNFSNQSIDNIIKGIRIIGELIKSKLSEAHLSGAFAQ